MRVAHADSALAQEAVRNDAHGAALADDPDRPVRRLLLDEHGREARDRSRAEIGQALRVWADDPQAAGAGSLSHGPLLFLAVLGIGLAEPGGHHHGDLDARFPAVLEGFNGSLAGHCDDGEFRSLRKILQARKRLETLDLGATRVDRVDLALEPEPG